MDRYTTFHQNFDMQVVQAKTHSTAGIRELQKEWGLRYRYLVNGIGNVQMISYFKFCISNKLCPVCNIILLLKDKLDPHQLILFIQKTYGIEHEN